MLTRVITALVLLPLVLGGIYYLPASGFALLAAIIILLAAWEWGELLLAPQQTGLAPRLGFIGACVGVGVAAWFQIRAGQAVLFGAAAAWLWAIFEVLRFRAPQTSVRFPWRWFVFGVIALPGAWYAILLLRGLDPHLLLAVCVLVWGADVGAYFAGRGFGRTKLARHVSPGKTWEGAVGGAIVGVAACLGVAAALLGGARIGELGSLIAVSGTLIGLVVVSVFGDLFESVLKRQAGAKDSGRLLPGHGGMLDRVDALIAVLPVAALLAQTFW